MNKNIKASLAFTSMIGIYTALSGCAIDKFKNDTKEIAMAQTSSLIKTGNKELVTATKDTLGEMIAHKSGTDDLSLLKAQLEEQQKRLEMMDEEQRNLKEQLKRQQVKLRIKPSLNANAGRTTQATASRAYIAFFEDESQYPDIQEIAIKQLSIIPNREVELTLSIPQDAKFIGIKVDLRYTKKRSQFLIPISSIDFDNEMLINIGACDVMIAAGLKPELTLSFTDKLKSYQQPLVKCI